MALSAHPVQPNSPRQCTGSGFRWNETAAGVEAIGAIAAVTFASWIAANDSLATRRREGRIESADQMLRAASNIESRDKALNYE